MSLAPRVCIDGLGGGGGVGLDANGVLKKRLVFLPIAGGGGGAMDMLEGDLDGPADGESVLNITSDIDNDEENSNEDSNGPRE